MASYFTYASYHSEEDAQDLTQLLDEAAIPYKIEHNRNVLDKIYIGDEMSQLVDVKIEKEKFEQVNELMRNQATSQFNNIREDYYLLEFTDEELIDVVRNKNEWNAFDQGLAEKILNERKVTYDRSIITNPASAGYMPTHINSSLVVIQYIFSILFPYAGILIGLATISAFKTLGDGTTVKIFDDQTRKHGKIMLVIGIVRTIYLFIDYNVLWFLG
jgi:hypothetical protein